MGRIADVSLATLRTILTVREKHLIAALLGFAEISIWFTIVQEALGSAGQNNWIVLAYAGGFAAGTYLGGLVSGLIMKGYAEIRVVTSDPDQLVQKLHFYGFGVTVIPLLPSVFSDKQTMLLMQTRMKQENTVLALVRSVDPEAFIMCSETKSVYNGFLK